jgi:predicted  nucleic acid-binding Zn-ribbon protein
MRDDKGEAGMYPYKCLRCGHDYGEFFDPRAPLVERTCPRCRSNSVRRLDAEKRKAKRDASEAAS